MFFPIRFESGLRNMSRQMDLMLLNWLSSISMLTVVVSTLNPQKVALEVLPIALGNL